VTNVGETVSNAALGGRLADSTTYYWYVASTIGGNVINGPVWSFTAANSVPHDPSPAVGTTLSFAATAAGTRLSWSEDLGAGGPTVHAVYFSTDSAAVTARTAATITPDANGLYFTGPLEQQQTYYWAVDSDYDGLGTSTGPVWNFNSAKKTLTFNTSTAAYSINGAPDVNGPANGTYVDDANVAVYHFTSFAPYSGWDIVVTGTKAIAIWVETGDISISGAMDVSGFAGASGYVGGLGGPGGFAGVNGHNPPPQLGTASLNGPGRGSTADGDYKSGSGAGYGGLGGDAGRYVIGMGGGFGGSVYGEPELYTLWGGSGGGGGRASSDSAGGGGGGGAIEFYAMNGNIDITSTAVIKSNGGTPLVPTNYGAGGGSGGSVRFIASGNVTVAGTINANGGNGGSITKVGSADNCGGGGGGGRIAIYKGGSYTQTGTITVAGGPKGLNADVPPVGLGTDGAAGTIYTAGTPSTLLAAYNPRPTDGDATWTLDPNYGGPTISWNPALGTTENKVYFSTAQADVVSGAALKATITAPANTFLRARKTYTPSPLLEAGKTYYWRVDTNGVAGAVWSFTVYQGPYGPTPALGATGVDIHNPALKWIPGGTSPTSWDVYFGTNSGSMTKIATMLAPYNTAGVPAGELVINKTYYWRVDEKPVPSGASPTGVVWNFVTRGPLCTNSPTADLNADCKVTFADFAKVAADWAK
jgi:hypothetical protein